MEVISDMGSSWFYEDDHDGILPQCQGARIRELVEQFKKTLNKPYTYEDIIKINNKRIELMTDAWKSKEYGKTMLSDERYGLILEDYLSEELEWFQSMKNQSSAGAEIYYKHAVFMDRFNKHSEALNAIEEAKKINSNKGLYYAIKAEILYQLWPTDKNYNNAKKSFKQYETAIGLEPENLDYKLSYAILIGNYICDNKSQNTNKLKKRASFLLQETIDKGMTENQKLLDELKRL